ALQDEDFDKSLSLHSIPVRMGTRGALHISEIFHLICAGIIVYAAYLLAQQYSFIGWINWVAATVFVALLVYQHLLVKPNDLSRVNLAFFTTNGFASILFCGLIVIDFYK
ncbi:MAG: 4-hydroxybenzoate octaprenyltransferase, partial [Saprospiraceae bacterium]|nr:4-hydroxybenzoate octaprenyltransferase [Saprospiraceae bacterium]